MQQTRLISKAKISKTDGEGNELPCSRPHGVLTSFHNVPAYYLVKAYDSGATINYSVAAVSHLKGVQLQERLLRVSIVLKSFF